MPAPPPVEALLLVDLQRAFVDGPDAVPDGERVLATARRLLAAARGAGALVVQLQNDGRPGTVDEPGAPGWALALAPTGDEPVIRKREDDGFAGTPLAATLDGRGVRSLAIAGVLSEMCVAATARTALARGLRVVLPHDGHATYDVPPAPGILERVPAALAARAAEWSLGDEVEIVPEATAVRFVATRPGD
ncbi:isochorismatase family protein [Patulibacter defluvii]|uniref:isochorismatase family protein n=1 Tax=Patulibacter defluvii TaxID=3095358 RepID=UPI002A763F51|nr:isochorismatase family protein [Patulibacter sp. DM4]